MAEIPSVNNILYDNKDKYLSRLYDYFIPENINVFRGTLACNVITSLLSWNTEATLNYLRMSEGILERFIQHIKIHSVTEFFFKLVSLDEGCIQFLLEQNLATILMNKFSEENKSIHSDIAQFTINLLQTAGPGSPLYDSFTRKDNVEILFKFMFDQNNTTCLVNGLLIIINYIHMISDHINSNDDVPEIITMVVDKLGDIKEILVQPQDKEILLPSGRRKPLGIHRCKIVELIDALIQFNNEIVINGLITHDLIPILIDLFFTYEHNSILHKVVYQIICRIIDRSIASLIHVLLEKETLHLKIIDYEKATLEAEENGASRTSCAAYSLLIAQYLYKASTTDDNISSLLNCNEWTQFYEKTLIKLLEDENKTLGATDSNLSNNESLDYGEYDMNDSNGNYANSDSSSDSYGSGDDLGSDEEDDDLDYGDESDIPSDNDFRDYDITKAEVCITLFVYKYLFLTLYTQILLTRNEIENICN